MTTLSMPAGSTVDAKPSLDERILLLISLCADPPDDADVPELTGQLGGDLPVGIRRRQRRGDRARYRPALWRPDHGR
ncbi:MAG TPA: hypothetical protein VFC00_19975 [Micromonosporaceae bacterium]|nr:hypothetical protein [Micromonosporaceae bacterium]